MCVKCSKCCHEFACGYWVNPSKKEVEDFNSQECPINFHYVANCVECLR